MKITLSQHAKDQILIRGIPLKAIEFAIKTPDRIVPSFRGRLLYQKEFGGKILEVVTIEENKTTIVITVYYLSGSSNEN